MFQQNELSNGKYKNQNIASTFPERFQATM